MATLLFYTVVLAGAVALAMPPTIRRKTWSRLPWRAFVVLAGIIVPVAVFLLSELFAPGWKGAAAYGWIDCFHSGKMALMPLVLWAAAGLYAVEVWEVEQRTQAWIVLGLLSGSLVAVVCLVHGLFTIELRSTWPLMLIPLYTAGWYSWRAVQLARAAGLPLSAYLWGIPLAVPFWIASIVLSRQKYLALPDQPQECFVVSATLCGHPWLVGSFIQTDPMGRPWQVSGQLLTFRQFEALWAERLPRAHSGFRAIYNRVGPVIARGICTPWAADAVYLALKPAEGMALLLLRAAHRASHPRR